MNTHIHNTDDEEDNNAHNNSDDEYIHTIHDNDNSNNSNKKEKRKTLEKGSKKGHNSDQLIAKMTARGLIMNCANCIRLQVSIYIACIHYITMCLLAYVCIYICLCLTD